MYVVAYLRTFGLLRNGQQAIMSPKAALPTLTKKSRQDTIASSRLETAGHIFEGVSNPNRPASDPMLGPATGPSVHIPVNPRFESGDSWNVLKRTEVEGVRIEQHRVGKEIALGGPGA